MKQTLLLALCCYFCLPGFAQPSGIYAISGQAASPFHWSDIRLLGNSHNPLVFENGKSEFLWVDAESGKEIKALPVSFVQTGTGQRSQMLLSSPTNLMSAAAALDKKHNRLFFASMHSGHLMWLDLNGSPGKLKFHVLREPMLINENYADESLNITRMAIGSDGYGYAISNDGNNFLRFSTGRKVSVKNLGPIHDDDAVNNALSIHNRDIGWGGDLVADVSGNLYLFSAAKNVFKINISSKKATYIGSVSGLPAQFSLNGAAVMDDGNVIVSSANVFDGFYTLTLPELSAQKMEGFPLKVNASDLASGNLLGEKLNKMGTAVLPPVNNIENGMISIFPNPVKNKNLQINFGKLLPGSYTISISGIGGRLLQNHKADIKYNGQIVPVHFDKEAVSGMYIVRITDVINKEIFSGKVFVE